MTDQRDPRIRALIVELAQSSAEAPTFAELEDLAAEPIGEGPVRPMGPQPSSNRGRGWLVAVAAAVAVLVLVGGAALLFPTTGSDGPVAATPPIEPFSSLAWSEVPYDEAVFGGAEISKVTVGGPGLVAVGSAGSGDDRRMAVWTSVDGITWARVAHDEAVFGGPRMGMESVTAGGPGLVAVGSGDPHDNGDAVVWTSVDGITWSRVPHDEAVFGGRSDQQMTSVTVGGPGLVAVGWDLAGGDADAAVWTSPDGVTWSRVLHDEEVFGGGSHQAMWHVTAGGPGLVAVGEDGSDVAVWTSVDGITWSRVPHDEENFGEGQVTSVTNTGSGLVAVGNVGSDAGDHAAVWTSPDGVTWSRVPHDEAIFGGEGKQAMQSVTAGGTGLVAVGSDGEGAAVWASPDGITWSRVPNDKAVFSGEGGMYSVPFAGLMVIGDAGGNAAVWAAVPEN